MEGTGSEHAALIAELTRRGFLRRAGAFGVGALVASAVPVAKQLVDAQPAFAEPSLTDATLQAWADTMIPGRPATRTDLGNEIHPLAILGRDSLPGAVEADSLALYHHPLTGFDALSSPFMADLQTRSAALGSDFLHLGFDQRVQVAIGGLAFSNPARVIWEATAAIPFIAFCAATMIPNATSAQASGYRVMGHPGTAPKGYPGTFSYRRRLARERTLKGYLS